MRDRHPTRTAVLAFLANGPAHRELIEQALGHKLQATMYEMRQRRLIHVHGWLRGTGNMRALRMVYALGDLPDAPRPAPERLSKFKRYYQKHKEMIKIKRRATYRRYAKATAARNRRLRALKKLKTNPFLQLNVETYSDLRRKATKPAPRARGRRSDPKRAGDHPSGEVPERQAPRQADAARPVRGD
jgi:hypothetical protein